MSSLVPATTWGKIALGSGAATATSLSSLLLSGYLKNDHQCKPDGCKLCDCYDFVLTLASYTFPTVATTFIATVALKVFSLPFISRLPFIPRTWDHFCKFSAVTGLVSFVAGSALTLYVGQHPTRCIEDRCSRCFLSKKIVYPLLTLSAVSIIPLFLSVASRLEKMTFNLSKNWAKVSLLALPVAAVSGVIGLYLDLRCNKMELAMLSYGICLPSSFFGLTSLEYGLIQSIWNAIMIDSRTPS